MSVTTIALSPQRAFHSTLSTDIVLDGSPRPGVDCALFVLYTFPQSIIIDRHELVDRRVAFEFWGVTDLELPVFALDQSAHSLLLVGATPADARLVADIPVHVRYGEPGSAQTSLRTITIASPASFWACPSSASEPPVANSTMLSSFAHFSVPSTSSHRASLQVPVASQRDLLSVGVGTAVVILAAFLFLSFRSWSVAVTLQSAHLKEQ